MSASTAEKPSVTFLGAAGTVTGSKHLISFQGNHVLVDCGLFQGDKELRLKNWAPFPIRPDTLHAIVLTHAHLDHTGYLPLLCAQGFTGPIYGTAATLEIAEVILRDSARLQEEEAEYANKHHTSKHTPAKPLYDSDDAEKAITQFRAIPRDSTSEILPQWNVTPRAAGHILGACTLAWDIHGYGITFSGDIGRYDVPILPDPAPTTLGDLFICESTYGNSVHTRGQELDVLEASIKRSLHTSGPIIVPSFAVGRTQLLLHLIQQLETEGRIPEIPVFVDSPMAIDATEIYHTHRFDFDTDSQAMMHAGVDPLRSKKTYFIRSREDSIKLNSLTHPRIIIAGSGMVTGGRVLHHLLHWLAKEETTILFVGFQAPHTRGARILRGESTLKIFDSHVPVRAHVTQISGLSAHGDRDELTRWITSCSGAPKEVKIVHGEPKVSAAFAKHLEATFGYRTSVAHHGEKVLVTQGSR